MYPVTNFASQYMRAYAKRRGKEGCETFNDFKRAYGRLEKLDLISEYMHEIEHNNFLLGLKYHVVGEKEKYRMKKSISEKEMNYLLGKEMPDDD